MTSKSISKIIKKVRDFEYVTNIKKFYGFKYGPVISHHKTDDENYVIAETSLGAGSYFYPIPSKRNFETTIQLGLEMISEKIPVFLYLSSAQESWKDFYQGEMKVR